MKAPKIPEAHPVCMETTNLKYYSKINWNNNAELDLKFYKKSYQKIVNYFLVKS